MKKIEVNPTTVRVPVFYGHSEAIHLELEKNITSNEAKNILSAKDSGVILIDEHIDGGYPCAANECENSNDVYVEELGKIFRVKMDLICGW